jgi:mannose-6-phosphate isomerase-like protein (cupin superfamily)
VEHAAAQKGADAHYHRTFSESFYVTSGTMAFYDGNRWM